MPHTLRLFAVCLALLIPLSAFSLEVRILDVHDGDTVTAVGITDSQKYKIRLMGVDTPEVDFFQHGQGEGAIQARDALRELLPKGTIVKISNDSDVDKHGRILGRILKGSLDINEEMLRQGWGFIYFIAPFDKRLVNEYSDAFEEAIENRRGLFVTSFEEPYLFRLRVRKQVGRNLVGDLETKQLFSPENIAQIPLWRRVFFADEMAAHNLGYRY
ncbi:endonuclease [Bdellovibrio bacteriovorus]|uniref:Endonuclease n=1 Tax=Bdellovibrio bacteriovorus TaxID=959 RepID=A0A150WJV6_BDEBC|nr:thermonuclease family protein [Bdellovibrio bacteriovorus]KYG64002.1 endonuclease [Bdellovibrio bacteriovorus]